MSCHTLPFFCQTKIQTLCYKGETKMRLLFLAIGIFLNFAMVLGGALAAEALFEQSHTPPSQLNFDTPDAAFLASDKWSLERKSWTHRGIWLGPVTFALIYWPIWRGMFGPANTLSRVSAQDLTEKSDLFQHGVSLQSEATTGLWAQQAIRPFRIVHCPLCGTRVAPMSCGHCPSCKKLMPIEQHHQP